jgi:hypothetical protein
MLKIDFTEKALDEVYEQFMEHPSGLIKKKLHVVYLKAQGLAHKEIERIARTSADSVTRYLKDYAEGGLSALGVSRTIPTLYQGDRTNQNTRYRHPFLSPYSPNLNLIERLWKFTKKKCLYNRYHETFCHFKAAIDDCIDKMKSVFKDQVKTLLNPKFQLFEKSAGVTA